MSFIRVYFTCPAFMLFKLKTKYYITHLEASIVSLAWQYMPITPLHLRVKTGRRVGNARRRSVHETLSPTPSKSKTLTKTNFKNTVQNVLWPLLALLLSEWSLSPELAPFLKSPPGPSLAWLFGRASRPDFQVQLPVGFQEYCLWLK